MRDYDPTTGRYIQADPLGLVDGASVYGYALQNPGRYVDPKGENSKTGRGPMSLIPPGYLNDLMKSGQNMGHALDQGISTIVEKIVEMCKGHCPPCKPYTKGTILYRWDSGHTHFPAGDPHLNLLEVVQDPGSCKCFYNRNTPFGQAIDPPPQPGWVQYFGNYAPPLSP